MKQASNHLITVISIAMGLLLVLSAVPWSRLTGNVLKDFSLFGDLHPVDMTQLAASTEQAIVDPELHALMKGEPTPTAAAEIADSTAAATAGDSVTAQPDSVPGRVPPAPFTPDMADGSPVIENYGDGLPLARFRDALAQAGSRTVRVAVIGDSYIEGDIICQNLRDHLQQRYGGKGVGFMAAHSDFPGFRGSVSQSDNGWTMTDIRQMGRRDSLRTLSGDYGKATAGASVTYKGTGKFAGTASWERSTVLYVARDSGTITLTAADGTARSFPVVPSGSVQAAVVPGSTSKLTVQTDVPGLVMLGTYLDGAHGVQVDCMSVRGNSGLNTRRLNAPLCRQMAQWADYDLIIVEFGMNVLSAEQTDYTPYMLAMTDGIRHLQRCYPKADILVMGVGDRGVKAGAAIQSLPTTDAMVRAQRETARRTGTHFWDTRHAMGGAGSIAQWRTDKLVNADYIHLNHKGGARIAALLNTSLTHALEQ